MGSRRIEQQHHRRLSSWKGQKGKGRMHVGTRRRVGRQAKVLVARRQVNSRGSPHCSSPPEGNGMLYNAIHHSSVGARGRWQARLPSRWGQRGRGQRSRCRSMAPRAAGASGMRATRPIVGHGILVRERQSVSSIGRRWCGKVVRGGVGNR